MPTNQGALKFVKQLCAAFARWKVSDETKTLYVEKLSKWYLTSDEWNEAMDKLVEIHTDDSIPTLASIYDVLKSVKRETIGKSGFGHMLFDMPDGNRYCLPVKDLTRLPEWPIGSSNHHLALPPGMTYEGEEPGYIPPSPGFQDPEAA